MIFESYPVEMACVARQMLDVPSHVHGTIEFSKLRFVAGFARIQLDIIEYNHLNFCKFSYDQSHFPHMGL